MDTVDRFVELIPRGEENAISRKRLVQLCVSSGLIESDTSKENQDRHMRKIMQKAKIDWAICNTSNGKGYYRPVYRDMESLRMNIAQERSRIKSLCYNYNTLRRLYEDFKHERKECQ